jgi:hypothetical protein
VAVYVELAPTVTEDSASSDVELESGATGNPLLALTEPFRIDPTVGVKTALSCAVDAANEVEHATVALWPLGATGRLAQPPMAAPSSSKVTVPHRAVLTVPAVPVAINVTQWFVTGIADATNRSVVVGCDDV